MSEVRKTLTTGEKEGEYAPKMSSVDSDETWGCSVSVKSC